MAASTTVLDIIKIALRKLDITQLDQIPDSDESNLCFSALNLMLDQWSNEKLMIYAMRNELFNLTATQAVYTIGDGGDFDTDRPLMIERAFVRFPFGDDPMYQHDFQLEIIPSSKYQEIFLKGITTTYPVYLFYNPTYPLGEITLYPIPSQACQIGISQTQLLTKFESLVEDISLPPGYESALAYNLAVEICPDFGKTPSPILLSKAEETKRNIKMTNTKPVFLKCDDAVLTKKTFNILAGF